jgi:Holliday junction resolvase RusA-like endonuclease
MEFIVAGTPRSANAPNRSRRQWREWLAHAAREQPREGSGPGAADQELAILIIYFYQGEAMIDVDNIAKSVLDGLKGVVFPDDRKVSELREAIQQYADWYTQQGYEVSVRPSPRELLEFLQTLALDMIARRNGENLVVQIKTSSPASFETVQRLARALDHRVGWELQVVYVDLPDPEWQPPPQFPERKDLSAQLDRLGSASEDGDQRRLEFLLLWSIVEGAARHRLSSLKIPPTRRISSSALLKMLVSEGIIEDDDYAILRRGLAARNALTHSRVSESNSRSGPVRRDSLRRQGAVGYTQEAIVPPL